MLQPYGSRPAVRTLLDEPVLSPSNGQSPNGEAAHTDRFHASSPHY
jgi:hypothetical protein